jgi:hypothetical protein
MATTEQVYFPRFALNITQAAEIGYFSCYFCRNWLTCHLTRYLLPNIPPTS